MTASIIQLQLCLVIGLILGQANSAQPVTGLSDREIRMISNEIYAKDREIAQMSKEGRPIPGDFKSDILSRFFPYSPTLRDGELELARAIIASLGRISADEPLPRDVVDSVIVWMIVKGWGEPVLVNSSHNANLDSAQFERFIDGFFSREEPPDYARTRTIERLVEEGDRSAADFDLLGDRLLATSDEADRRLLINWLLQANSAGELARSPIAARALLLNADQVRFAKTRLAPLLESNSDPEILRHLATLAVAEDSEDLADLLMGIDLPDEILLSLEPLAASTDRDVRFKIAYAIAQRYGAGTGGTAWLLSKSKEQAAPEVLRVVSIKQLAKLEPTSELRDAFLNHYNSNVPALRIEALRALRAYDLPRALLEDATIDRDSDIQREAWQQLHRRFDESTPINTKWQLYPNSRNEDIGMAVGVVTAVSAAITVLTALITPVLAAAFWKSLALFLVGAAASLLSWGFLAFLAVASQHQNAFADGDVQKILYVVIVVLWTIIAVSWFSAIRAHRQRAATTESELAHDP